MHFIDVSNIINIHNTKEIDPFSPRGVLLDFPLNIDKRYLIVPSTAINFVVIRLYNSKHILIKETVAEVSTDGG